MLISKFDLYRNEWLDLVFENRNKEYGAYTLRQEYAGNMVRAMVITFGTLSALLLMSSFFRRAPQIHKPNPNRGIVVIIAPPPVIPPVKKPEPASAPKSLPPAKSAATRFVTLVPTPDHLAVNPPKIDEIRGQIGQETIKGPIVDPVPELDNTPAVGNPGIDDSVHPNFGLDVMPAPVGGESAWAKFLNKNLRYPGEAQDEQVSGKVFLSFIIEKDGSLSNISVVRPAGHGFDEEALRVLKLARAWKPGMQNGQAVRVKYTIPINFQLTDNN